MRCIVLSYFIFDILGYLSFVISLSIQTLITNSNAVNIIAEDKGGNINLGYYRALGKIHNRGEKKKKKVLKLLHPRAVT